MKTPKITRVGSMNLLDRVKYSIKNYVGFIPILSDSVFLSPDAIFDKLVKDGMLDYIRQLRPIDRTRLHFTFGKDVRNIFLLWHPKNPYTVLKLMGVTDSQRASSPYHPDNLSWDIIRRLMVAADGSGSSMLSATTDLSENLMYSLLARADDDESTLAGIKDAMVLLVNAKRWDLIDEIFVESVHFLPSPAKLTVLLESVADNTNKIAPVNYLRVAQYAVNVGVEVKH